MNVKNQLKFLPLFLIAFNFVSAQQTNSGQLEKATVNDSTDVLKAPPPPPPPLLTDPTLIFSYDAAGNQTQRLYCLFGTNCIISRQTPESLSLKEEVLVSIETIVDEMEENVFGKDLKIYPNPTKDIVFINIKSELIYKVESIKIFNSNASLIQELKFNADSKLEIDLTGKPSGVYFVHMHMNDGNNSITKKIIKE